MTILEHESLSNRSKLRHSPNVLLLKRSEYSKLTVDNSKRSILFTSLG